MLRDALVSLRETPVTVWQLMHSLQKQDPRSDHIE